MHSLFPLPPLRWAVCHRLYIPIVALARWCRCPSRPSGLKWDGMSLGVASRTHSIAILFPPRSTILVQSRWQMVRYGIGCCIPNPPYSSPHPTISSSHPITLVYSRWRPPLWEYPSTEVLDFSNLLVPTMDSTRALFLLRMLHKQRKAVLMVGAEGTAKTSTALMFFSELDPVKTAVKRYRALSVKRNRSEKTPQ